MSDIQYMEPIDESGRADVYTSDMERDRILIMRFPSEVKEALRRAAEADHRSMSGLALKVIADHLEREGFLRPFRALAKAPRTTKRRRA